LERIIETKIKTCDEEIEPKLRPCNFENYIGQEKLKSNMKIYIDAAKIRGDVLDHVLLYGPPGLGKTTFANIIANQMNAKIKITSGPAIENTGDMAALLNSLNDHDVLFIDEIHRLNHVVEELLYSAMEDFALDIVIGRGQSSKSIRVDLPKFTLVGATTRAGLLTAPLRDRFGVIHKLEFYSEDELKKIIINSAKVLGININIDAACEIARRSRGTPRVANRLLKRVRDFAQIKNNGLINICVAKEALDNLEIDSVGLDITDRKVLDVIINKFCGGPVGLDTLAAATGEDRETIEDVYEPYIIQLGYIQRTPRGRVATRECYKHFGLTYLN
jgi:Holliday junction DNA helicase RuvB